MHFSALHVVVFVNPCVFRFPVCPCISQPSRVNFQLFASNAFHLALDV